MTEELVKNAQDRHHTRWRILRMSLAEKKRVGKIVCKSIIFIIDSQYFSFHPQKVAFVSFIYQLYVILTHLQESFSMACKSALYSSSSELFSPLFCRVVIMVINCCIVARFPSTSCADRVRLSTSYTTRGTFSYSVLP